MKELTMFYLDDCGYCLKARRALDELVIEGMPTVVCALRKREHLSCSR